MQQDTKKKQKNDFFFNNKMKRMNIPVGRKYTDEEKAYL